MLCPAPLGRWRCHTHCMRCSPHPRIDRKVFHGATRENVLVRMRAALPEDKQGVLLVQGGSTLPVYDTDGEILFRQEAFFHYLFGVNGGTRLQLTQGLDAVCCQTSSCGATGSWHAARSQWRRAVRAAQRARRGSMVPSMSRCGACMGSRGAGGGTFVWCGWGQGARGPAAVGSAAAGCPASLSACMRPGC